MLSVANIALSVAYITLSVAYILLKNMYAIEQLLRVNERTNMLQNRKEDKSNDSVLTRPF